MFIGATRFSIFQPSSHAWNLTKNAGRDTPDELKSVLYSPHRIEPRLDIFLNFSLPIIAKAAEHHFIKHVVMYSEEMPEQYKERLEEAAARWDFLVLNRHVDGKSDETVPGPHMIAKKYLGDEGTYGIYRLDDDDLLSESFFSRADRFIKPAFAGMRLSFASGVTGFYENGEFSYLKTCYHPMIAIGLLNICHRVDAHNIIQPSDAPHIYSDRYDPVILDSEEPMYFWTRHCNQDTNVADEGDSRASILKELNSRPSFGGTEKAIELFPTLEGNLRPINFKPIVQNAMEIGASPVSLAVEVNSSTFEVKLEVEAPLGTVSRAGLVSFQFEDSEGIPVKAKDVAIEGLTSSPNDAIGWYKYLQTDAGRVWQTFTVGIESGHRLSQITVMQFGKNSRDFTVHNIQIGTVE